MAIISNLRVELDSMGTRHNMGNLTLSTGVVTHQYFTYGEGMSLDHPIINETIKRLNLKEGQYILPETYNNFTFMTDEFRNQFPNYSIEEYYGMTHASGRHIQINLPSKDDEIVFKLMYHSDNTKKIFPYL